MAAPVLQTAGPGNMDELLTTTLVNMRPGIRDNIFKSNAVFDWLYKKNKIKVRGGASISHGVMYGTNTTARSYQRYETLDVVPVDGLTRDQWQWAQYAVSVSIDGFTERVANKGESALENLLDEKKSQAEMSLQQLFEQHLFASSSGSKDIKSIPEIITNSGSVGDINGSTSTWWQSQVKSSSGAFATSQNGLKDLTNLYNTISIQQPVGPPEMIISSQTEIELYEAALTANERFTSTKEGDAGFGKLLFKSTPWIWSPQAPVGTAWMLHSSALEFIVNSDTDFITTEFVKPYNQDARTAQILVACALATGNRRKLGKVALSAS